MPEIILTNPDAPLASAQRLVAAQQRSAALPAALAEPVAKILGRWLAGHPDCRLEPGTPDRTWCEAAQHAHQHGQACATFRRKKRVTAEVENGLKWIALAVGYAGEVRRKAAHADSAVRSEAEKLTRALRSRRMTWDQLADGLKRIRSLVQTRGRQRAGDTAVREPLALALPGDIGAREIVTPRDLASVGRVNGWCTHEAEYAKKLKGGANRFFLLEDEESDEPVALLSLRPRSRSIEGARAPGNKPIALAYRDAVQALLNHFNIRPNHSDLLALGLTSAVPDAELSRPDLVVGDLSVWFGSAGEPDEDEEDDESDESEEDGVTAVPAMLIRAGAGFALLRPLRPPMSDARFSLQQGHSAEFDSDDLLGRLLAGMRQPT